MDTKRFYIHALEIARANLPYTMGHDKRRAVRSALEEAHVNLGQVEFFAMIDALGGHEALVRSLVAELGGETHA